MQKLFFYKLYLTYVTFQNTIFFNAKKIILQIITCIVASNSSLVQIWVSSISWIRSVSWDTLSEWSTQVCCSLISGVPIIYWNQHRFSTVLRCL